ncbi:hypothetical protein [Pseudomonas sp.]
MTISTPAHAAAGNAAEDRGQVQCAVTAAHAAVGEEIEQLPAETAT